MRVINLLILIDLVNLVIVMVVVVIQKLIAGGAK